MKKNNNNNKGNRVRMCVCGAGGSVIRAFRTHNFSVNLKLFFFYVY